MSLYKSTFPAVLLIESDPQLSEFFSRMISNCGYEVLTISHEEEFENLNKDEIEIIHACIINEITDHTKFFETYEKSFRLHNIKKAPIILITAGDEDLDPIIVSKTFHISRKMNFNFSELTDKIHDAILV
ncbi:hypothetical protein PQO03_07965 [Lentisphaera profundi]|uniref:Response regulatory domain-containing protein n=1 Tax=Lentisphaera profundi TaxID=1658616 RepID=A0ABY7VQR0_9BACT|nr:hypothetical protein [Lentisphaera profundi]WDE95654.1 hypothetical protein PQO03_07965 [Lentisphaera profundi]